MVTSKTKSIETESVSPDYRHYDKFVGPGEKIELGATKLKWYNLAPEREPVPAEIDDLAHQFLKRELAKGNLKDFGNLGFVILHRCGNDFYFLLVETWRNGNELWESIYAKNGSRQNDFQPFTFENHHRGTFCVWELAVVGHERQAWQRFLLSGRSTEAVENYLQDCYRGEA